MSARFDDIAAIGEQQRGALNRSLEVDRCREPIAPRSGVESLRSHRHKIDTVTCMQSLEHVTVLNARHI